MDDLITLAQAGVISQASAYLIRFVHNSQKFLDFDQREKGVS